ncbi:DUF1190 domain-containing protein [Hyphomicrobium sp.]|uniref:DUF1190 domain-containing protein n=1 Tax=Hyphomicrobium sp. TaxID=82 RepID=UPI003F718478
MRAILHVFALIGISAALAGCGDSGSPTAAKDERGVIASASDCASFGPGAVDACAGAIERAVKAHEATATAYTSLEDCEKAVGERACERSASGHYRIRLSAFMVTLGATPRAEPLYPVKGNDVGFQTSRKDVLLANDRSLVFSRLAVSVAERHAASDPKRKRQRL